MRIMMVTAMLAVCLCSNATMYAQEKPPTTGEKANTGRDITPLRVQVVMTEYEGEKKVSSLPYTFLVNAEAGSRGASAKIRMVLRVPITTGGVPGPSGTPTNTQIHYEQVGTNLDCWAVKEPDGRFNLHLSVERSWVYLPSGGQKVSVGGNDISRAQQPVIEQLNAESELLVRDGQTAQTTLATDPVSGRVTKLEVTVNAVK